MSTTPALTQTQYKRSKGTRCPICGAKDSIIGHGVDINEGTASQECHCVKCDGSWYDNYKLVGFTPI